MSCHLARCCVCGELLDGIVATPNELELPPHVTWQDIQFFPVLGDRPACNGDTLLLEQFDGLEVAVGFAFFEN